MLGKNQRRKVYQFESELFSKDQSQWDLWGPDFLLEALRAPWLRPLGPSHIDDQYFPAHCWAIFLYRPNS